MTDEAQDTVGDDLWGWLDPVTTDNVHDTIDASTVTAVMVVHNAHPWLARQLLSLVRLDPRPGRIVAVDNASTDDSPILLAQALNEGVIDDVITLNSNNGFGAAVEAALGEDQPQWIWLLHDDSAPFPNALAALLDGAVHEGAAVVLPKLLQPRRRNYPETLAEAGQSISRGGRRVPFVDAGDVDQHQLEAQRVLGGSTAGMLIRGDVWRELAGLAPELPLHRDGVDLGWRAGEAGHVVTTWPAASVTHREAGRTGERISSPALHPHESDRLAALRVVAARGEKPPGVLGLLTGSVLRACGFLVGKSPTLARAELRAAAKFAATPKATTALASRTPEKAASVKELLPARSWSLFRGADQMGAGIAERYRDISRTQSDTSLDELTGDDFAGIQPSRRTVSPVLLLILPLVVLGVVAGRSLLGVEGVAGGGMLPAPDSFAEAWEAYLRPNVGVSGANAPWLLLAAFVSTLFVASPQLFSVAALLLLPALAGGAAFLCLRRLGLGPGVTAAGAGVWAGAVVLLGIVGAGDLSGMTLAVTGPMLTRSIHRLAVDDSTGTERLRGPAAVALWLVLVTAAWPVMLPMLTIIGAIWVVSTHRRWIEFAIAIGIPWLFIAPWIPTLVRWPARLLTGADPLAWTDFPPAGFALLAGRILPSGIPSWVNLIFFGVLFVLSAVGLLRLPALRSRVLVLVCIGVPLVAGVWSSRFALTINGGEARALLSGWALLVVAAMLVVALLALRPREDRSPISRPARMDTAVLILLAILAMGSWAWVGFQGPVVPSESRLPGYVGDVMASERDSRVLLLQRRGDGGLAYNVATARQPQWGTGEREPTGAFAEESSRIAQSLGMGVVPEDLASQLTDMGFSHLYMGGFDEEQLAGVGNAPGLTRAAVRDGDVVWTVAGLPSRIRVVESGSSTPVVDGTIIASDTPRQLVLAEEPDSRWWVSVDGVELQPSPDGAFIAFELPGGVGGDLEWGLRGSWVALGWQISLIVVALVLLAPTLGATTTARRSRP